MSYQEGMDMPPLIVTGWTGANGNTKRTSPMALRSTSRATGTKSVALAPSPCRMMMVDFGESPVW